MTPLTIVSGPAAPLMAFIVGAVLYYALAKAGMESKVLEMAAAPAEAAPEPAPAEAKAAPEPAPAEPAEKKAPAEEAKGEDKKEEKKEEKSE